MRIGDREQSMWWVGRDHTKIKLHSEDGEDWTLSVEEAEELRDQLDEAIDHASREAERDQKPIPPPPPALGSG